MNLIQMLLNLLGSGNVLNKMAGMLGESSDRVESAARVSIPAVLGSLLGQTQTTDGARRVAAAVQDSDEGLLGNLAGAFDAQGDQLAHSGSSLLGSLLGGNTLSSLAGAIGRYSGMSANSTASLLGALTPLLMGFLKKQVGGSSGTVDAASLTRLLSSQKENIAAAIPSGLSGMLDQIPGLAELTSGASQVADRARAGANQAASVARQATASAVPAFMWWLIPLALLAAGGWWFMNREPAKVAEVPVTPTSGERVEAMRVPLDQDPMALVTKSTTELNTAFDSLKTTLEGVKDEATARDSIARLDGLATQFEGIQKGMDLIPTAQRSMLLELINKSRAAIRPIVDTVMALPGVGAILKPHVDALMARLDQMAPATPAAP